MIVGLIREMLSIEWVSDLVDQLRLWAPGVEWRHDPSRQVSEQLMVDGDACYPFKKMVRACLSLMSDVDVMLIPRIVNIDSFLMCPNFRALPDMVVMNRKRQKIAPDNQVIIPLVEVANEKQLRKLAVRIYRQLFQEDPGEAGGIAPAKKSVTKLLSNDISRCIGLIGHPYLISDKRLNNGVPEILKINGYETISARDIPFDELNLLAASRDFYAKKLYWRSAREALGAFLYFLQKQRPAGIIHLVPFNCGVDALLRIETMAIYKQIDNAPPYMIIVCDEHTQQDHVVTRVEAFLDMVNGVRIN